MAEYVMGEDENQQDVARRLLDAAGDRAGDIQFTPRANVHGGGVFQMPDDLADEIGGERITRVDTDPIGTQRAAARGEDVVEGNENPTEFNDRILAGEAPTAASPATGPNPLMHGVETDEHGRVVTEDDGDASDETTTKPARRSRKPANTNTTE